MTDAELIAMRTRLHSLNIPADSLPDSTIRACGLFEYDDDHTPADFYRLAGCHFVERSEAAAWSLLLKELHPELFPEK